MARRTLRTALILGCYLTWIPAESTWAEVKEAKTDSAQEKQESTGARASSPEEAAAAVQVRFTPGRGVTRARGGTSDASRTQQVVHLNSTGTDPGYRGRRSSQPTLAKRLRAIRNGQFLEAEPKTPGPAAIVPPTSDPFPAGTPNAPAGAASQGMRSSRAVSPHRLPTSSGEIPPGEPVRRAHPIATLAEVDPLTAGAASTDAADEAPRGSAEDTGSPENAALAAPARTNDAAQASPPATSDLLLDPEPIRGADLRPFPLEDPRPVGQDAEDPQQGPAQQDGQAMRRSEPSALPTLDPAPFEDLLVDSVLDDPGFSADPTDTPESPYEIIPRGIENAGIERSATGESGSQHSGSENSDSQTNERMRLGSRLGVSTGSSTTILADGSPKAPAPGGTDGASRTREGRENVLLSNRSPVLVVKTHGSPTMKVGRTATYHFTASNLGDLAAEDVEVLVNVPDWAEVTLSQASAGMVRLQPNQQGHSVVQWTISKLDAQGQQRLRLNFVPRSSRPVDLGVTWSFKPVSGRAQIQVQEPKLQMSVVGPEDIQYNDTKIYTITVSNPGSGDAENVVLTLLPISDAGGSAGVREMGTLQAGSRQTVEVELTARQAGELAVRATAVADGGLQADGQQRVRVRRANLEIEAVGPEQKYAGTEARYAFKISNTGDATASDVVAVAALPMAATYVNSSVGGTYDATRGKVRWSVRTLQPGAFQIVELCVTLMGEGKNRLDLRAAAADQLTAAASVTTTVESLADLKLLVNDPKGAVAVGAEMSYELRIVNRGTKAAHDVNVVGYFSEGIEPVAVRGWRADLEVGQVVFDQIPRIAPGQEMVVQVAAQANRPGDHVFRAELGSNDPVTKLAVEEWTRFYGDDARSQLLGTGGQTATAPDTPPSQSEQRR